MNDYQPYSVVVVSEILGKIVAPHAVLENPKNQPIDSLVVAGNWELSDPTPNRKSWSDTKSELSNYIWEYRPGGHR